MTTAFARRFQSLVDHMANGSKKHFAQLTGKSPSTIYRICRGASRPSTAYLQQLYESFRIDLNWLLTGEHSTGQETTHGQKELVFAPQFDVEASAGSGCITFSEEVSESFAFNKNWLSSQLGVYSEQVAFVTVKGDSMNPTLEDGDMILVDLSQHQLVREGIYLLQTEDGLHTKRLKTNKNGIQVISDNPEYPSWQITPTDAQPSRIAGKVVWCARGI